MTRRHAFLLATVALVAGLGSFGVTVAARAQRDTPQAAIFDWLNVDTTQREVLLAHDPSFDQDLVRLRGDLEGARTALAKALDDPQTSNERLRACSEAAIAANTALERRVMDHLLSLRDHLAPAQQRQLFNLCAEGVRQGSGWRWRHGRNNAATNPGKGPARSRDSGNAGN